MTCLARVARHPLFWPLVAFLVMVVADTVATHGTFLSCGCRTGISSVTSSTSCATARRCCWSRSG